jgi:hypothetical protein
VFSDRLRRRASDDLANSVCCGLTEVHDGDDSRSLLARADSALYSAKASGPNRSFVHSGTNIREHHAAGLPCDAVSPACSTAEDGIVLHECAVPASA